MSQLVTSRLLHTNSISGTRKLLIKYMRLHFFGSNLLFCLHTFIFLSGSYTAYYIFKGIGSIARFFKFTLALYG